MWLQLRSPGCRPTPTCKRSSHTRYQLSSKGNKLYVPSTLLFSSASMGATSPLTADTQLWLLLSTALNSMTCRFAECGRLVYHIYVWQDQRTVLLINACKLFKTELVYICTCLSCNCPLQVGKAVLWPPVSQITGGVDCICCPESHMQTWRNNIKVLSKNKWLISVWCF